MRLDGDDLSFVCTHCRGLVRRSCLAVMCGEAEVLVVLLTGRRPCFLMARARWGSSACACKKKYVMLGGCSAA